MDRPLLRSILLFAFICCPASFAVGQASQSRYPALYPQAAIFEDAIRKVVVSPATTCSVSGLIVPHHLLATDLLAAGFARVASCRFRRVVVLFPDHFQQAEKPFAATRRGFETAFGAVETDASGADALLTGSDLVERSDLFARDHGIGALLPFIRFYLPGAKVLPIAISGGSQAADWDAMAALMRPLLGPDTLLVQSTDFSHYLDAGHAKIKDQETLNVIAARNTAAAARLTAPSHVDSVGALYLQMKLQKEVYRAVPLVIASANSQAFAPRLQPRTTSYVVALYHTNEHARVDPLPDAKTVCFAGDTFFGRGIAAAFGTGEAHRSKVGDLNRVLGDCPLILNLSGVLLPEPLANPRAAALPMSADQLAGWFRELHVVAVDIANNHTHDFGQPSYESMRSELARRGIATLEHGSIADLKSFRIVAFTDGDNHAGVATGHVAVVDVETLARSTSQPPLIAFLHWGDELSPEPAARQRALAAQLQAAGVSLILGAGSHIASPSPELIAGGRALGVFSLGNFLFDQNTDETSGRVAAVTFFPQGTFFVTLLPVETGAPPRRRP